MIAMALSCNPSLLIADEPTTALDVTIQAQILELMKRLQRDHGSSIILITHDMGVVADLAERVVVMYAGSVVEEGSRTDVFRDPQHPYTWGLLGLDAAYRPAAAAPARRNPGHAALAARAARGLPVRASLRAPLRALRDPAGARGAGRTRPKGRVPSRPPGSARRNGRRRSPSSRSARARDAARRPARGGRPRQALPRTLELAAPRGIREHVHAVDGVSLEVRRGETLGIVGESGCGKSTLGRLPGPAARADEWHGPVRREGHHEALAVASCGPFRREMQMIFQDPVRVAEPTQARDPDRRRPVSHPPHGGRAEHPQARAGAPRGRRPVGRPRQPLPARVLGRPAAADRRRPRARARRRS